MSQQSPFFVLPLSFLLFIGAPALALGATDLNSQGLNDTIKTALAVTSSEPLFGVVKKDATSEPAPAATTSITSTQQSSQSQVQSPEQSPAAPLIIDNDATSDAPKAEYQWKEITDSQGRSQIEAGAKFPVSILTAHTSKTAKSGDIVEGRTMVDIKIGGKLVAPKGSKVVGHVATCKPARKLLHAELSMKRWMRPSGALGLQFDEIVTPDGDHLPLVATPARQPRIVKNDAEGRVLGVNKEGEIAAPLSMQVKSQMIHFAIRAGASAGGFFSMGAMPVAYGLLGAASPSFVFMHPVGKNVKHRRLKGFGMGVVSGLPGGFLISDSIISGQEAIIKPGDQFLAEFRQSFTGEPAVDAQLVPGAKLKVHGQILN